MNFLDQLRWRGLVRDMTPGLPELLTREVVTAYIGFDPSAPSLHVGSFLPIMVLSWLQRSGHCPIAIVGGGTGLIGDPSGKTKERTLLTEEQARYNLGKIEEQLRLFLDFESKTNPARIINNADWLLNLRLVEFLRDIGKHFTVNNMLTKDSVKTRLEREDGLSFTEFSYMLLQAYDFLELFDRHGCCLQIGGTDQWSNILAGSDLIRRLRGAEAHGLVFPLVTTASGQKFGKTEAGAVWLNAEMTTPFKFYQYFINTGDQDVSKFLRYFTYLSEDEVVAMESATTERPEKREAQRRLAAEVTRAVHGPTALVKAIKASEVLFGADMTGMSATDIGEIFADVPATEMDAATFQSIRNVTDLAVAVGLTPSKGEARRLIQQGGLYLNNTRMADPAAAVSVDQAIDGVCFVFRKGAKQYHLVRLRR